MKTEIHATPKGMSLAAAWTAAEGLRQALRERGEAFMIVATGASQLGMLEALVAAPEVEWGKVTVFHLDEYIGLPGSHPASFRRYLRERFVRRLPTLGRFHEVNGEADPKQECRRLGQLIASCRIDVACIGIGENGHVAFNDPPADFDTTDPYIIVTLDEACRRQQLGEGWFAALDDVPRTAISMSVSQILKSRLIVCTVPDQRKARAVRDTLEGPVSNAVPASILRRHPDCRLFLDRPAASLLLHKNAPHITEVVSDGLLC